VIALIAADALGELGRGLFRMPGEDQGDAEVVVDIRALGARRAASR